MLRKAVGTLAAFLALRWPALAVGGFLLWLYYEPLSSMSAKVWDDWMCAKTEKALREDINADVDGAYYVLMLSHRKRREREYQERFRQRWRSRLRSVRRVLATVFLFLRALWQDLTRSVSDKLSGALPEEDR
jgi:hypothetical protein